MNSDPSENNLGKFTRLVPIQEWERTPRRPVSEEELRRYVDGTLGPDTEWEVLRSIFGNAELERRVALLRLERAAECLDENGLLDLSEYEVETARAGEASAAGVWEWAKASFRSAVAALSLSPVEIAAAELGAGWALSALGGRAAIGGIRSRNNLGSGDRAAVKLRHENGDVFEVVRSENGVKISVKLADASSGSIQVKWIAPIEGKGLETAPTTRLGEFKVFRGFCEMTLPVERQGVLILDLPGERQAVFSMELV